MLLRFIAALALLGLCAGCGADESRSIDVSAETLAEIVRTPYVGGNGPGGFGAARLSGLDGDGWPEGMHFTGHDVYLHEMGFAPDMMITAINGKSVVDIFAARWERLRLKDPTAFDQAHYKDLVEYLFLEGNGDEILLTVDPDVSKSALSRGDYRPQTEVWRLAL